MFPPVKRNAISSGVKPVNPPLVTGSLPWNPANPPPNSSNTILFGSKNDCSSGVNPLNSALILAALEAEIPSLSMINPNVDCPVIGVSLTVPPMNDKPPPWNCCPVYNPVWKLKFSIGCVVKNVYLLILDIS